MPLFSSLNFVVSIFINEYSDKFGAEFMEGKRPWGIQCDVALPCATQNEINEAEAKELKKRKKQDKINIRFFMFNWFIFIQ